MRLFTKTCQGIIEASWNWPFNSKDIEVYGQSGYVLAPEKNLLRVRTVGAEEKTITPSPLMPLRRIPSAI